MFINIKYRFHLRNVLENIFLRINDMLDFKSLRNSQNLTCAFVFEKSNELNKYFVNIKTLRTRRWINILLLLQLAENFKIRNTQRL